MSGLEGLLAGRTLGDRYRIEAVIGRGGMGVVYCATDERLARSVAVKVISAPASEPEARDELRARFHREARVAAGIRHPNVVTVFDFGTDPELDLDFLVMELLRGEDLAARLARAGPLPPSVALALLQQAARGLAAGHRAGLIHRDVKPANLFLEDEDRPGELRVLVLDFGIAQLIADEATRLTRIGQGPFSPAYASPEQLRGERDLTPASDVFSLGVIAYQLLSGERLFARDGADRLAGLPPQPIPSLHALDNGVPADVDAVIHRALATEPEQRFPDATAFADALGESTRDPVQEVEVPPLGGGPVRIRSSTPAPPVSEPAASLPAALQSSAPPTPVPAPPVIDPETDAPTVPRPQTLPPASPAGRRAKRGFSVPLALFGAVAVLVAGWLLLRPDRRPVDVVQTPDPAAVVLTAPEAANEPAPAAPDPAPGAAASQPAAPQPIPAADRSAAKRLNGAGVERFERGDVSGAAEQFRRATELAPNNAEFRNNYAWALFRAGETGAALRELNRVIELNPRRGIAHANLGEVRLAQGDTAGAVAAYRRFLELNTDPGREAIARRKLRALGSPR